MNVNDAVRIHLASVEAGHGDFDDTLAPVSYTHLTLPTILRV